MLAPKAPKKADLEWDPLRKGLLGSANEFIRKLVNFPVREIKEAKWESVRKKYIEKAEFDPENIFKKS